MKNGTKWRDLNPGLRTYTLCPHLDYVFDDVFDSGAVLKKCSDSNVSPLTRNSNMSEPWNTGHQAMATTTSTFLATEKSCLNFFVSTE